MTVFGHCWPMPVEVIDWEAWGFGFHDYAGWNARLGVSIIRLFNVSWPEIETSPNQYDFVTCRLDDSIRRIRDAGMQIYLNPSPRPGQAPAPAWHQVASSKPPLPCIDTAALERFAAALAEKYGQDVAMWGWGNENDSTWDSIGVLASTAYGGDWSTPAGHQFAQYTLPFARGIRSRLPDATIAGPETMTYGYASTMLQAENDLIATSGEHRATDIVSTHGYAMTGHFPEDALKRLAGEGDTLENWMKEGNALNGRREMIGEVGIEHGEDPQGLLTYAQKVRAMNRFQYVFFHDLDSWLTSGRPAKPKSLVENDLYSEMQDFLRNIKHPGVSHAFG